jgi:hypothetical protein
LKLSQVDRTKISVKLERTNLFRLERLHFFARQTLHLEKDRKRRFATISVELVAFSAALRRATSQCRDATQNRTEALFALRLDRYVWPNSDEPFLI